MAKAKLAEQAKKTDEKNPNEGADDVSMTQARVLRDRHPALTHDEEVFFESRQPVEQSRTEGGRTTAVDVLPDMVKLGARYEHARSASTHAAMFITPAQMRWLFEHIVKLGDAVAKRDRHGATTIEVSIAVQRAWDAARPPRNALTSAMSEYAKGSESDQALLSQSRGTVTSPDQTLSSLMTLAPLAEQWLARTDAQSRIAAREASLTAALVAQVKTAATALREAIEDDTAHPGSRNTAKDTPEINTLEGRVLLTLRTVRHNHQRAMEADPTLEAVAVPESLRSALGIKAKAKAAAGAPVDPAAGGADATKAAPKKKKRSKKR